MHLDKGPEFYQKHLQRIHFCKFVNALMKLWNMVITFEYQTTFLY